MTRNCQTPGRKRQTKKPLSHTWDKSRCFCDTTQIDVKNARSLTRTIIRAPMDNGWESRRSLLGACAVRSALRSPFAGRPPPRFHHRGLSEKACCAGYFSPSLVCAVWLLRCIIRRRGRFVKGGRGKFPEISGRFRVGRKCQGLNAEKSKLLFCALFTIAVLPPQLPPSGQAPSAPARHTFPQGCRAGTRLPTSVLPVCPPRLSR